MLIIGLLFSSCGEEDSNNLFFTDELPRDYSWSRYATADKFQTCNDCYAYAAAGLVETVYNIQNNYRDTDLDLSESYFVECYGFACGGSGYLGDVANIIANQGIPAQQYSSDYNKCLPCELDEDIVYYKISDWQEYDYGHIAGTENHRWELMRLLLKSPVAIIVESWDGLKLRERDATLVCFPMPSSRHAVVLIGYENYGEKFVIKNSHGNLTHQKILFDGSKNCGFAEKVTTIGEVYWQIDNKKPTCTNGVIEQ